MVIEPALQQQIIRAARQGELKALPPILTFQSVMDSTVSTRAVVESLYRYLPDNGSELVVFDINQSGGSPGPVSPCALCGGEYAAAPAPRAYTTTVVTNATAHTLQTVARTTLAQNGKSIVILYTGPAGGYVLFVACGGAVSPERLAVWSRAGREEPLRH